MGISQPSCGWNGGYTWNLTSEPACFQGRWWREALSKYCLRRYWLHIFLGGWWWFPTYQVWVVRFYVRCAAPPPTPPPPPPLAPPSPRRTSSASSWSQWSSPDLICQFCLAVVVAGPHLAVLFGSGRSRNSSASSWSQWASPDFNRRDSVLCGPRRTSTGGIRRSVGLAGLQPERFGAPWASPDFNRTSTATNKAT